MRNGRLLGFGLTLVRAAFLGHAQGRGGRDASAVETPPAAPARVTHHSIRMGGQEIKYTATTANYILKSGDGTPKASFFFVAYTRDVDSFIQAALSGAH